MNKIKLVKKRWRMWSKRRYEFSEWRHQIWWFPLNIFRLISFAVILRRFTYGRSICRWAGWNIPKPKATHDTNFIQWDLQNWLRTLCRRVLLREEYGGKALTIHVCLYVSPCRTMWIQTVCLHIYVILLHLLFDSFFTIMNVELDILRVLVSWVDPVLLSFRIY